MLRNKFLHIGTFIPVANYHESAKLFLCRNTHFTPVKNKKKKNNWIQFNFSRISLEKKVQFQRTIRSQTKKQWTQKVKCQSSSLVEFEWIKQKFISYVYSENLAWLN